MTMFSPFVFLQTSALLSLLALFNPASSAKASDIKTRLSEVKSDNIENLAYNVRLLVTEDGGLIGVCLELFDKSAKSALEMRRPAGSVPLSLSLYDSEGHDMIEQRVEKLPKVSPKSKSTNQNSTG